MYRTARYSLFFVCKKRILDVNNLLLFSVTPAFDACQGCSPSLQSQHANCRIE